jgi:hypothetical protein
MVKNEKFLFRSLPVIFEIERTNAFVHVEFALVERGRGVDTWNRVIHGFLRRKLEILAKRIRYGHQGTDPRERYLAP